MEIERKYLIEQPPEDYQTYPFTHISQGYLSTAPVVRVRKEDDDYYLTYKGKGLLAREEYNLPLTKESYEHLIQKADGIVLEKRRYRIPLTGMTDSSRGAATASQTGKPSGSDSELIIDKDSASVSGLAIHKVSAPVSGLAIHNTSAPVSGLAIHKVSAPNSDLVIDNVSAPNSDLVIELDVFEGTYEGLILAEVEFPSLEEAQQFIPPSWFGRDVTFSGEYQNSRLSAGEVYLSKKK